MSESAHDYPSPPVSKPTTDERLWRVRKDHHTLDAALRSHGESHGIELQILCDGDVLFGRRYDQRELATAEAHALLQHYRASGWTVRTEPKARRRAGVYPA